MTRQDLPQLPRRPGVYIFKHRKHILYIGKATILAERVRSYFSADLEATRGAHMMKMVAEATMVDHIVTDSVLEALLLEAELIKRHQPSFNSRDKDNKSFWNVVITREDFPRILLVRAHELAMSPDNTVRVGRSTERVVVARSFGPFPHASELKEAMRLIRQLFPYRDLCNPKGDSSSKPCFNRQIGLCPGACDGSISKSEYARTIRHLVLFFRGRKGELVRLLKGEMRNAAKNENFEVASKIKRQIFALEHIRDVSLLKRERGEEGGSYRIEGYDVAHTSGKDVVGVMVVAYDSEVSKSDYRTFKLRSSKGNDDIYSLREILERRLAHHEWMYPRLIVVDGGKAQRNVAEDVLREAGVQIPVVSVVKDEHHKARAIDGSLSARRNREGAILLVNSEAHRFAIAFHRKLRSRSQGIY